MRRSGTDTEVMSFRQAVFSRFLGKQKGRRLTREMRRRRGREGGEEEEEAPEAEDCGVPGGKVGGVYGVVHQQVEHHVRLAQV